MEKIEKEISEEIGVFSSRKAPSKVKVALDDDLFGSPPKPSQKKDAGTDALVYGVHVYTVNLEIFRLSNFCVTNLR